MDNPAILQRSYKSSNKNVDSIVTHQKNVEIVNDSHLNLNLDKTRRLTPLKMCKNLNSTRDRKASPLKFETDILSEEDIEAALEPID